MARLPIFCPVSWRRKPPTESHTLSIHDAMFPGMVAPRREPQPDPHTVYKVIIIGAGPGGSRARVVPIDHCSYFVFEKGVVGNTLAHYPHGKYVMALPSGLELPTDHVAFEAGSKEQVVQQLEACVVEHDLQIQTHVEVTGLVQHNGVIEVQTTQGTYRAASVVLATGRDNLRELDATAIAGARLPHVLARLIDPRAYTGQHVIIIGAGDSAAQAALMLLDANTVTMVDRSSTFRRMNSQLQRQIDEQIRGHNIDVYHHAEVVEIYPGETVLEVGDKRQPPRQRVSVKTDWVLVQMGAEPPEAFLKRAGIGFQKFEDGAVIPTLKHSDSPLEQFQSATADGVYLIGSLIGNNQIKRAIQDGAAVIDHILGLVPPAPGEETLMQTLASIPGGDVDAKLRYLTACAPLLYAVPRPQLRDMALLSTVHHVGAGQTIGLQGKYSTALSMVIDGQIALSDRANPQHTMILRQGELFGEELLLDHPFAASAISVTAAVLLAIPRRTILELMQRVPSLQQQIEGVQTLRCLWRSLAPDLDLDQVRWLATQTTRLAFHEDDTLFSQGEGADAVYVLLQGSITLSGRNNEGIDYLITYLGSGAYFGEIALLHTTSDSDRREATATIASRTCHVLRIHKADFLTFLEAHPDLKKQIERERSQRVLQQAVRAMPRI